MADLLVAIALCYVLIKIPFWVLGAIRGNGRRSFIASAVKGILLYKTFGLVGGLGKHISTESAQSGSSRWWKNDPYATSTSTDDGQYMLPLDGVPGPRSRRGPRPSSAKPEPSGPRRDPAQLDLFTRRGNPRADAVAQPVGPHAWRHPEVGENHMLPIIPRPTTRTTDDTPPSPSEMESTSRTRGAGEPTLFTRTGRVRPEARARPLPAGRAVPTTEPGQTPVLPLVGDFTHRTPPAHTSRTPVEEATTTPPPMQVPGQQSLLTSHGDINPRARARRKPVTLPPAYKGLRPQADGQYRLPLDLTPTPRRHTRTTTPPPATVDDPPVEQTPPVDEQQLTFHTPEADPDSSEVAEGGQPEGGEQA